MSHCEHKQLVLTSQRGTDGLPIYSCGVPLAVRELIAKWQRAATHGIELGYGRSTEVILLEAHIDELSKALPSGCGALFKVKSEEITVEVGQPVQPNTEVRP